MNVVFISPNFPPHFHLFCRALKEEGARVLGIGDAPEDALSPELRPQLDGYYYVPDMNRHDEMVRAMGYFTWKYGRIDRVDSLNEHWLDEEARLRDDFHLYGLRPAEIREYRSKRGMKPFFEKAGIKCPAAERFTTAERLRAFAREQGFPLVLKPDIGVGAARTFKVENSSDLEAAIHFGLTGYLAEEFIHGTVETFDGIADRHGEVVFASSLVYSEGVMETVNRRSDMLYWTRPEIPPDLDEAGRRTVNAFDIRERFFHIEYFRLPDGSLRALEINLRPPGGYTTDMMNWAAERDVYRLWARVVAGKPVQPEATTRRPFSVMHVARRREKRYRHSHQEVLAYVGEALVAHRHIDSALAGAMGDEAFFLRHREMDFLHEAAKYIQAV